ncbi:unnamed protein product [Peronospora belbahrii]|uniref:DUF7769 domain-containing protein n=1 Tax=Peronospora belbahrii TaxID=622444 RepID=A0AAU9LAU1_9STRA|nr:unnamed protein product [Peronospora belbahrii]CAH0483020.1 unnamed protein product [Peronospora belbahrii]
MITDTTLEGLSMAEMTGIESTELPQETPPKLLEMSFESPSRVTMEMKEPQGFKQEEEEEVGEDEGGVEEDVVVVSSKQGSGDAVVQETKRKNLTDQERVAIVHYLLANSAAGRLKHGDMKTAATHFGVHRATIRRLWKMHTASSVTDGLAGNVASRIKGHSGRKPKVPDEELKVRIAAIPVERRMTGRGLSTALQVSNSVVVRLIKSGKLRRHPKKLHYVM